MPEAPFSSPAPSPDGPHVTYHRDGTKWEEFHHRGGERHGPYVSYHPGGIIKHVECHYQQGRLDGDLVLNDEEWKSVIEYKDGVRHGLCRRWRKGHLRYSGVFKDGKPDGLHQWWSPLGGVEREQEYRDGVVVVDRQTDWSWNTNGSRYAITTTRTGDGVSGRFRFWYANGLLAEERELAPDTTTVVKMVALTDRSGRDCLLQDGEITVWKLAMVLPPPAPTPAPPPVWAPADTPAPPAPAPASQPASSEKTYVYIRLTVPADAKRVTPRDEDCRYKSRVEFARVDQIVGRDGTEYKEAVSCVFLGGKGTSITYRVGEIVRPDSYNPDPNVGCGAGINVHAHRDHCDAWI